ncbi:MAG: hypothetical protein Sylvanvirus1_46 [Sylvanvirus sp.]|uniref:Uncharacterized protein n=1 Tax=Sylvanvirus sp. TaxID=2487774 RepID=A0A3G5AH33_9VIRU|nr:MAG: hypothetical protein Sylvanvirus1_46 [Sylvanvirus sp.]
MSSVLSPISVKSTSPHVSETCVRRKCKLQDTISSSSPKKTKDSILVTPVERKRELQETIDISKKTKGCIVVTPISKTNKYSIPSCIVIDQIYIIAISGKIGSGKNYLLEQYVAPWLLKTKQLSYVSLAFADQLKLDVMEAHDHTFMDTFVTKEAVVRKRLQSYGLEKRESHGENYWVDRLHPVALLHLYRGIRVILVTDVRFGNECEYVKDTFGSRAVLIRIEAPLRVKNKLRSDYKVFQEEHPTELDEEKTKALVESISKHSSETALDDRTSWDYIVKNDVDHEVDSGSNLTSFLQSYFHL